MSNTTLRVMVPPVKAPPHLAMPAATAALAAVALLQRLARWLGSARQHLRRSAPAPRLGDGARRGRR